MTDVSLRNFNSKSLRCKRDIICVIDRWLDRISKNELEIELCDYGRKALEQSLQKMRGRVLNSRLSRITKPYCRYILYIYEDYIQLGLETFKEYVEFGEDGEPLMPRNWDKEDVSDNDDDEQECEYTLIARVPVELLSVEEWCKENDVKPVTARQWIRRGRMSAEKKGRELYISAIQYKPDALYANKHRTVRFKQPGVLSEELVAKYPRFSGEVFDILITSNKDRQGSYRLMVISRKDSDTPLKAQAMTISEAERDQMINALVAEGLLNSTEKYYQSPLGEGWLVRSFAQIEQTAKEIVKDKSVSVSAVCSNKAALDPVTYPAFSIQAEKDGEIFVNASGYAICQTDSAEVRLLRCIFDKSGARDKISSAFSAAGINTQKKYPWDKHILLIDSLDIDQQADTESILQALPRIAHNGFAFSAGIVIFALEEDSVTDTMAETLASCGYEEVCEKYNEDEEDEEVPALRFFYAYAD